MELWVRSQDKMILVEIKAINLNYNEPTRIVGNCKINEYGQDDYFELGIYKTKERALEVLDEIQDKINDILNYDHLESKVYEMPEE